MMCLLVANSPITKWHWDLVFYSDFPRIFISYICETIATYTAFCFSKVLYELHIFMKMLPNLSTVLFSQLFKTISFAVCWTWTQSNCVSLGGILCSFASEKRDQWCTCYFFLVIVRTAEVSPMKASYSFDKDLQRENCDQIVAWS